VLNVERVKESVNAEGEIGRCAQNPLARSDLHHSNFSSAVILAALGEQTVPELTESAYERAG